MYADMWEHDFVVKLNTKYKKKIKNPWLIPIIECTEAPIKGHGHNPKYRSWKMESCNNQTYPKTGLNRSPRWTTKIYNKIYVSIHIYK